MEEPENYLHPELLPELAEEFREYADKGGQVFISTHSPDFVNALQPDELFWLQKSNGATTIRKASEDATIKALYANGDIEQPLLEFRQSGAAAGSHAHHRNAQQLFQLRQVNGDLPLFGFVQQVDTEQGAGQVSST